MAVKNLTENDRREIEESATRLLRGLKAMSELAARERRGAVSGGALGAEAFADCIESISRDLGVEAQHVVSTAAG